MFKLPCIDWCAFNEGTAKAKSIQKLLIKAIKKGAAVFFQKCPFNGKFQIYNLTVPSDVIQMLPLITAKVIINILTAEKIKIINFEVIVNIHKY